MEKKKKITLRVLLGSALLLGAGMLFMLLYSIWAYYNTFTSFALWEMLLLNSLPWGIAALLCLVVYLVLRRRWKKQQ